MSEVNYDQIMKQLEKVRDQMGDIVWSKIPRKEMAVYAKVYNSITELIGMNNKSETVIECCSECGEQEIKLDKIYHCQECGKPLKACGYCQNSGIQCDWKDGQNECNFYNSDGTAKKYLK